VKENTEKLEVELMPTSSRSYAWEADSGLFLLSEPVQMGDFFILFLFSRATAA